MRVVCFRCGVEFNKPPSQIKKVKRVFCSKACHDAEQTIFDGKTCEICGETFKVKGNMARYTTCRKTACREEKVRRVHDAQRKEGTKSSRRYARLGKSASYFRQLKYHYGMTKEQYFAMRDAQNGKCAICETPTEHLVVDHCHASGVVRGLLCHACNKGLGNFRDTPGYLAKAIDYLKSKQSADGQKGDSDGD